jgi:hypothetical protein
MSLIEELVSLLIWNFDEKWGVYCCICESENWEVLSGIPTTAWHIGEKYVSLTKKGSPFFYRVFLDLPICLFVLSWCSSLSTKEFLDPFFAFCWWRALLSVNWREVQRLVCLLRRKQIFWVVLLSFHFTLSCPKKKRCCFHYCVHKWMGSCTVQVDE